MPTSASLVHRYYDPSTGQFLSVDPLVDQTGTPYAYTGGDPVNLEDPGGMGVFSWLLSCVAWSDPTQSFGNAACDVSGLLIPGPDVVKVGGLAVSAAATGYEQAKGTHISSGQYECSPQSPSLCGGGTFVPIPDTGGYCPLHPPLMYVPSKGSHRSRQAPAYNTVGTSRSR